MLHILRNRSFMLHISEPVKIWEHHLLWSHWQLTSHSQYSQQNVTIWLNCASLNSVTYLLTYLPIT